MDTHASWDALARTTRHHGPLDAARLSDDDLDAVLSGPTLVGLPDGRASHLLHVLDRQWFTQRVRASTAGRRDLWTTSALAPLVTVLVEGPVPLHSGGELAMAAHFQQAVVGPESWLPVVPAGGIVALRFVDGAVEARAVPELTVSLERDQSTRELLARHYRNERWHVDDEPTTRHTLTRAVSASVLEVPHLFDEPRTPLDELLHDPLQEEHRHAWRDIAAWQVDGSISFSVEGMPEGLSSELDRRARVYGMSFDQFVIAVLGHLAWRTPFAEDMEPYDSWLPPDESRSKPTPLRPLG